jgi:hypothetical protein
MILLHCVAFYTPRNEAGGEALTKYKRSEKNNSPEKKFAQTLNNRRYHLRRPNESTDAAKNSPITERKYTTSRESSTPRLMEL